MGAGRVVGRDGRLGVLADESRDPVLTTVVGPGRLLLPLNFDKLTHNIFECDLWREPESLPGRAWESLLWREFDEYRLP